MVWRSEEQRVLVVSSLFHSMFNFGAATGYFAEVTPAFPTSDLLDQFEEELKKRGLALRVTEVDPLEERLIS